MGSENPWRDGTITIRQSPATILTDEPPSRDDGVTRKPCPVCNRGFEPSGRRRHCSDACRQAAYRRRHSPPAPTAPVPPKGRKREMTVYECERCGARELGQQRCEPCNTWMNAVGIGNNCPACGDPVSVEELMKG